MIARHHAALFAAATLLSLPSLAGAQEHNAQWPEHTALTTPPGRVVLGLFSPSRLPITDRVELQSTLLLNAAVPNLGAQVHWLGGDGWTFSTRHTLRYPTLLLGFASAPGVGGLLPSNSTPPQLLEVDNEVLVTRALPRQHHVTLSAGVIITPTLAEGVQPSGAIPAVDFPFLYQRLGTIGGGAAVRAGVALSGYLTESFDFVVDLDVMTVPSFSEGAALEQGIEVLWRISSNVSLAGGFRFTYANYPGGPQAAILPVLDLQVAID